ncbi:MAG TPA: TolC family protein, partial [Candidatus Acidoferrales bacterium]|nr:TolC family protein [Candidatus Acidoferrales bacterium]
QQELVRTRNQLALANTELSLAMEVDADRLYQLTDRLAERSWPATPLSQAENHAVHRRSDLKAIAAEVKAGDEGLHAAQSSFGPRINVFADSELDNVSPFANGSNNWAAGAELQFDLFSGGQKSASVSRARANLDRISAMKQAAEDGVRLEVRRAYYDLDSARQMLEVTKTTIAQAEEGLRIVSNRYGAGMTTITDLLRAEDAERAARTSYWQAVYRSLISYASLKLATGELAADSLNSQSPVVTP